MHCWRARESWTRFFCAGERQTTKSGMQKGKLRRRSYLYLALKSSSRAATAYREKIPFYFPVADHSVLNLFITVFIKKSTLKVFKSRVQEVILEQEKHFAVPWRNQVCWVAWTCPHLRLFYRPFRLRHMCSFSKKSVSTRWGRSSHSAIFRHRDIWKSPRGR